MTRFIMPARDQSIQRRTIVNVYVVADPFNPSECLVLDLADPAWRHTDNLCSRGKSEGVRRAKPDPQANNLLLMRFQHRNQLLDGSMVGERPLHIALCKPGCKQLHSLSHPVVLAAHVGFEPRSS
jgi:hypothetical protein